MLFSQTQLTFPPFLACELKMSRPEIQAPPEIFYNDEEARKYTSSSRIIDIQVYSHTCMYVDAYKYI